MWGILAVLGCSDDSQAKRVQNKVQEANSVLYKKQKESEAMLYKRQKI